MSDHLTRLAQTGHRREQAQAVVDEINRELLVAIREARQAGVPKVEIHKATGLSRPTLDKWLGEK